jgi:hypothetical protein
MISLDVTAPEAESWPFGLGQERVDGYYSTGQAGFVAIILRRVKGWRYKRISYLPKPCQTEQPHYRCLEFRSAIERYTDLTCAKQK